MSKFKIGDRVRIINTVLPEARHLIGEVAAIIGYDPSDNTYELDIPAPPPWRKHVWAVEKNIEPYYDGNERVSWSSCVWQPTKVSV